MREIKSNKVKALEYVDALTQSTSKYNIKLLDSLSKNMSRYCETIMFKEKKFFNPFKISFDVWESGAIVVRLKVDEPIDKYCEAIKLFEKVIGEEVTVERV